MNYTFYLLLYTFAIILSFSFPFRFGRVQSVKILSHKKESEDGGEAATVAFMDIKSANKAHGMEHKMEDRLLRTNYYDPSTFDVNSTASSSICDRNNTASTASPRVTNPEDCGPGPGGGLIGGGSGASVSGDLHDTTTSSRSSHGGRDFRSSGSSSNRYEDPPYGRQSRGSRSYRGQTAFER